MYVYDLSPSYKSFTGVEFNCRSTFPASMQGAHCRLSNGMNCTAGLVNLLKVVGIDIALTDLHAIGHPLYPRNR